MKIRARATVVASSAVLAASLGVVVAQAAFADPAGCKVATPSFTLNSTGHMTAKATASCSGSATRTLRVEIKHVEAITPDVLVAANEQDKTGTSYSVSVNSCDNGNTAKYYGRGFFTSTSTYHDSAQHNWHVCN